MSRLARLSLANRGLVALIAILVAAFGLITVPKLKQQLFPSLDFPAAVDIAFISQPLAIVVIGGLISSTALTLVLVPTLYTMIESRREQRTLRNAPTSPAIVDEPATTA